MNTPINSDVNSRRLPNVAPLDLLTGPKDDYHKFCLPLFEASIKCDWKAAKALLDQKPDLVRQSITENGETALHVAASAKVLKKKGIAFARNLVDLMQKEVRHSITETGEEIFHVVLRSKSPIHVLHFVKNLVDCMNPEDLELENKSFDTALYLAAVAGNLETIKIMVEKNRALLEIPGGERKMMPLYAAAVSGDHDVVKYLYENSNDLCDDVRWTNVKRGLLLKKCVENNMFDVALQIVKKYPELGHHMLGILAQKPAAAFAERYHPTANTLIGVVISVLIVEIVQSWKEKIGRPKVEAWEGQALPFLRIILDDIVELPKQEIESILMMRGPNAIKQVNKPVSDKLDQALELQKLISKHIVNMHVETQNIIEQDSKSTLIKGNQAVQLEKVITEHITKMQVKTWDIIRGPAPKDTHSSGALFSAAEMGNTVFVIELIRRFPDIMWKVNDNNQTIFHIAVENRHEDIYAMLYEIGYMKDSITSIVDQNGNNMLHLVAQIAKKKKLQEAPGVVFQMQRELQWFKEVESMINPSCIKRKNKDGLTPHELFTKEHEDLLAQSVKWLKGTANQCIVVAILVATIAFAAAITIPGGYHQENGIPVFYRYTAYKIFILADAISLFASSTTTVLFISFFTSRFVELDFLESIPLKITVFLSTLFLSISAMVVSFIASFFVIYHKEMRWIPIIICVITVYPVFLYVGLQYDLFREMFRSTCGFRYFFKPKKHFLYYRNPVL